MKCIKFVKGNHKNQYGYFKEAEADKKVKSGEAVLYDPVKHKEINPKPKSK